jgi:hypothetical protein
MLTSHKSFFQRILELTRWKNATPVYCLKYRPATLFCAGAPAFSADTAQEIFEHILDCNVEQSTHI